MSGDRGWIGVDLDGTLAWWGQPYNIWEIGRPIPEMVERVKKWIADGIEVRIVTARVAASDETNDDGIADDGRFAERQRVLIESWCRMVFGETLRVTASKDFKMIELWDDRAVRVRMNEGRPYPPYDL